MRETLLGILLILGLIWLIVRLRQSKAKMISPPPKSENTGSFHAVAIKYSASACDAAKEMTGRRFLSSAAPRLPLPDCDHADCRCRFTHYKDRRADDDRRNPFASEAGYRSIGTLDHDRRKQKDRRAHDDTES